MCAVPGMLACCRPQVELAVASIAGGVQAGFGDAPLGGNITDTDSSRFTRVKCAARHRIPPPFTAVSTRQVVMHAPAELEAIFNMRLRQGVGPAKSKDGNREHDGPTVFPSLRARVRMDSLLNKDSAKIPRVSFGEATRLFGAGVRKGRTGAPTVRRTLSSPAPSLVGAVRPSRGNGRS